MSIEWLVWCDTKQVLSIIQLACKEIKNDCVARITLSFKQFFKEGNGANKQRIENCKSLMMMLLQQIFLKYFYAPDLLFACTT